MRILLHRHLRSSRIFWWCHPAGTCLRARRGGFLSIGLLGFTAAILIKFCRICPGRSSSVGMRDHWGRGLVSRRHLRSSRILSCHRTGPYVRARRDGFMTFGMLGFIAAVPMKFCRVGHGRVAASASGIAEGGPSFVRISSHRHLRSSRFLL